MCGVSPLFVYTMSQVQICACTRICIWRMYIIELLSEMVYKVYKSNRSYPTRLYDGRVKDLGKEVDYGSFFRGDGAA